MKNVLTLALIFLTYLGFGQINTPAASPFSKVSQDVGLSTVTVEYSRPGVKDREIFAEEGLVPFGKKWRTGANAATKITFSDEVMIGDEKLEGGSYAILTTPGEDSWDVHFFPHESSSFSSYLEKDPALTYNAPANNLGMPLETFTITVQNVTSNSADLMFAWENTVVAVPMEFEVDSKVMANIDRVMAGPSSNDYYQAASYLHSNGKELDMALKYINKATEGDDPKFWQVRRKALILADMGKKEKAIEAAKMSMELAKEAGNEDYVRMNKKSIAEWSKK